MPLSPMDDTFSIQHNSSSVSLPDNTSHNFCSSGQTSNFSEPSVPEDLSDSYENDFETPADSLVNSLVSESCHQEIGSLEEFSTESPSNDDIQLSKQDFGTELGLETPVDSITESLVSEYVQESTDNFDESAFLHSIDAKQIHLPQVEDTETMEGWISEDPSHEYEQDFETPLDSIADSLVSSDILYDQVGEIHKYEYALGESTSSAIYEQDFESVVETVEESLSHSFTSQGFETPGSLPTDDSYSNDTFETPDLTGSLASSCYSQDFETADDEGTSISTRDFFTGESSLIITPTGSPMLVSQEETERDVVRDYLSSRITQAKPANTQSHPCIQVYLASLLVQKNPVLEQGNAVVDRLTDRLRIQVVLDGLRRGGNAQEMTPEERGREEKKRVDRMGRIYLSRKTEMMRMSRYL